MAKVKTWVWVVIAVCVIGVLGVVAMAAGGIWFARTHIQIRSVSPVTATNEFERVRQQFAAQKPLIELDARGRFLHANTDRPAGDKRPETLWILAFNPDDGRVVKMNIPFWLLRLKTRGTRINIGGRDVNMEDLKLTVEDLERYGPTLIIDQTGRDGERVLVWSQ